MISAIMGRYYFNQKTEADSLKKIQIWSLKQPGLLDGGYKTGTINWTNDWTGNKSSIDVQVNVFGENNYVRLIYSQTNNETGEQKHFDHKYPLVTTPCHFGGKRYWFICSVYKSGFYCGKRVAVLYKGGDYFACRHCYELSYNSRNLGGISKIAGQVISFPELARLEQSVKRKYYKGKMTKRHIRLIKKQIKSMRQMRIMAYGLSTHKK